MKIKKFRIRPRLPTIGKILKALLSVKQLPPDVEQALPELSENFLENLCPTAFYQTWAKDEIPAGYSKMLSQAGLGKSVAVSALVATVGALPEERIAQLLMEGETQSAQIVTAFAEESADLSLQFLLRLLTEEASGDGCVVSEPLRLNEPAAVAETLGLLEADQEGISVDAAQHLSPRFTRVVLVAWSPLSRKRHAAASAKKKSA